VELRQLEYFVAVARHGQFTRAADALWVTQSALSQQIRRLEAELGVVLFRRTPRGAELTPAGEDLLARAESALGQLALAREELAAHAGATRGRVRVAATTLERLRLPAALAAFHHDHPGVQVALRHAPLPDVLGLVQTGAVDLAIAGGDRSIPAGLAAELLCDEPLIAILPAGDPLAGDAAVGLAEGDAAIGLAEGDAAIGLAELRGRAFILAEPDSGLRETVMAGCQAAGFSPVPLFEVSDPATVCHLVAAGLGVSIVPASWLESAGAQLGGAQLGGAPRGGAQFGGAQLAGARLVGPALRHRVHALTPATGRSPLAELLVAALHGTFG